jgi:hypothetical protein
MLFEMLDSMIAEELGVEVDVYIEVIEEIDLEDADFIINAILNDENPEEAKVMFNKFLQNREKRTIDSGADK